MTNRTSTGRDEWFVATTAEPDLAAIPPTHVYEVPALVEPSESHVFSGDGITVTGRGFEDGTTVNFWRDADNNRQIDSGEAIICSEIATSRHTAVCTFTLLVPPFKGGAGVNGDWNYVNAVDGHGHSASVRVPLIHVEPHLVITSDSGSVGGYIHAYMTDLDQGDRISRIKLARSPVCDNSYDADQDGSPDLPCGELIEGTGNQADAGGTLNFTFHIPRRSLDGGHVFIGIQELRVTVASQVDHSHDKVLEGNIRVTPAQIEVSADTVLSNQSIVLNGTGFTGSAELHGGSTALIGPVGPGDNHGCPDASQGRVTLAGRPIPWRRVNNNLPIEISSAGTWVTSVELPVDSATTEAGTRQFRVVDCAESEASVDLTFPDREVSITPAESGRGSEVVVAGRNFPAGNQNSPTQGVVHVEYDTGGRSHRVQASPDASGNFTVVLRVPKLVEIPARNTVRIWFPDDEGATVLETLTHRVTQGTISLSASSGSTGETVTISARDFLGYASLGSVEFGARDITPIPKPSTGGDGHAVFHVRIPAADMGTHIIRVEIGGVTASQPFFVLEGEEKSDGPEDVGLNWLIREEALDSVFKFDNDTKEWRWYINNPDFRSANNLPGLSSGDPVWIRVTRTVTADILGKPVHLTCVMQGATENCWNLIGIP